MSTDVKFDQPPLSGSESSSAVSPTPEAGTVTHLGNAEGSAEPDNDWQQVFAQFSKYISLDVISSVFEQYKQVIIVVLLFLGAIVTVKVTLAVLDVVHEIPLLAPFLELVGLGYSVWFTYRYLWEAEKRVELVQEFNKIKNQVLGS
ncbi:MAG: CAAD domain-containing protein [Prochlorotrichaceae cyanobacterium]